MARPKNRSTSYDRAMRQYGYADGVANKPARFRDVSYQVAWRRGREARLALREAS